MKYLLPFLLFLAACSTPQDRCIKRNTQDLRAVSSLIAETEGNLARGYALEKETVWGYTWDWCYAPPYPVNVDGRIVYRQSPPYMCDREIPRDITRPKAIDLKEEQVKLDQLRARYTELSRMAGPAIARCKALYPDKGSAAK